MINLQKSKVNVYISIDFAFVIWYNVSEKKFFTYDLTKEEETMPYNPEEQKNDILFMGMSCGTDKVVSSIEKDEQLRVIRECELPRSMKPDQESFEKLGFEFEDIDGDVVMCKAKLPEGWTMKIEDSPYHTSIFDEKGRKRVTFFYKGVFYDRNGHMVLHRRYIVKTLSFIKGNFEDAVRIVVYDRSDNSFVKISPSFPNSWCDEYYRAHDDMYEWMKKEYPECEDPLAYWD